ncbi:pirin family protein [Cellulomonas sp. PhB143]|uniref:pirin family protein n=1 Tax=Cellulomonas sp. PhB143 TaxID=2485186 RepID=UPI000F47688B|nr:pirin family protein [Cellulomonas sp. PhB143]ROS76458.1 hypothetical protein EDF32_1271 [Cellulomonas sp. PhB143]
MSNLETRPDERTCEAGPDAGGVQVLAHRDVPLGGPRSMDVRRTIPQRVRSLVGAWCFCDHYGPDDVSRSAGMQVPPHPHTGLQTVSWLFEGEILHRDSTGSLETVRPGELNLMTAGRGISHSEESPSGRRAPRLHGVQLWTALPAAHLDDAPSFEHRGSLPTVLALGARVQVFLGSLGLGGRVVTSPATAYSPLVGAQIDLDPGSDVLLDVDPGFEHGLLVDAGEVRLEGEVVPPSSLGYVGTGRTALRVQASNDGPARVVLIGGEPFEEEIVMWWNFVGRTHDDVARARADWTAQLAADGGYVPGADALRFGEVLGYGGPPLPAPRLPDVRLRPRRRV